MTMTVIQASGLPARFDAGGTPPDPYVEVEVAGDLSR